MSIQILSLGLKNLPTDFPLSVYLQQHSWGFHAISSRCNESETTELSQFITNQKNLTELMQLIKKAKQKKANLWPHLAGPVNFMDQNTTTKEFSEILSSYASALSQMQQAGTEWVLCDLDQSINQAQMLEAYQTLAISIRGLNLMLVTYHKLTAGDMQTLCNLPVQGLHINLHENQDQIDDLLYQLPQNTVLSLGIEPNYEHDLSDSLYHIATEIGLSRMMLAPNRALTVTNMPQVSNQLQQLSTILVNQTKHSKTAT